ncbi:Amidinotransferase family protein [Moritella sp. JT01]|uniref:citrulline utilization hydrolase CtlX n=1 Tax=Moritella sp. JT01 TaxID=756698 RepID=UPI000791A527|nr:arginine deiminase-related protein [Moritella sp. JT01]KXO09295.1 Amidinotransferase family protein [Moritella sp. JT01]
MALIQAPNSVVMVRPWKFFSNPETAVDNAFQKTGLDEQDSLELDRTGISLQAKNEFDIVVTGLNENGINVHVFDDFGEKETPDSVFPNNWFSTHSGGHVALYPMFSQNRRRERRSDIIEMLKANYRVQDVIDFSGLEWDNLFLEGTGAMVLDNVNRIAYTAKSNRSNEVILERFCTTFQYEPMAFDTADATGTAIYHTNVMMCVGSKYALICLDMIPNEVRREAVRQRLEESGIEVIELSFDQVDNFAGNAIELTGNGDSHLVMSQRARDALTTEQIARIEQHSKILSFSVPTIELAGGSIRCMIAGIHLSPRT